MSLNPDIAEPTAVSAVAAVKDESKGALTPAHYLRWPNFTVYRCPSCIS